MNDHPGYPNLDPERVAEHTRRFAAGLDAQAKAHDADIRDRRIRSAATAMLAAIRLGLEYVDRYADLNDEPEGGHCRRAAEAMRAAVRLAGEDPDALQPGRRPISSTPVGDA